MNQTVRYMLEELKFIKSPKEAGYFLEKISYRVPRLIGAWNVKRPVPPSLQLEPTNMCNANCASCGRSGSVRERGFMPLELFRKIIDQAADAGTRRIHLYMHGEPLMHPEIAEMIHYIKLRGLSFHLTTNGMLLNRDVANRILQAGVSSSDHVVVSILGNASASHEGIMRGIRRDQVVQNVLEFVSRRGALGSNGPVIETIFYVLPENAEEKDAFVSFWRNKVDHARFAASSELFRTGKPTSRPRQSPCSIVMERMAVYWNGEVTRCCADFEGRFTAGSLRESSIRGLWSSPALLNVRAAHSRKEFGGIPFCGGCDM